MSETLPEFDGSTPADRELEAALHSLRPAGAAINPADALFEAGRLAGSEYARWRLFAWRGVAAVLAVALGMTIVLRPTPAVIEHERLVAKAPEEPTGDFPPAAASEDRAPEPRLATQSMLAMRQVALERGVDQLPALPGGRFRITHVRDPAIP